MLFRLIVCVFLMVPTISYANTFLSEEESTKIGTVFHRDWLLVDHRDFIRHSQNTSQILGTITNGGEEFVFIKRGATVAILVSQSVLGEISKEAPNAQGGFRLMANANPSGPNPICSSSCVDDAIAGGIDRGLTGGVQDATIGAALLGAELGQP